MQQRPTTSFASRSAEAVFLGLSFFRVSLAMVFRVCVIALFAAIVVCAPQLVHAVSCSTTQSGLVALYKANSPGGDSAGFNYGYNNATLAGNPSTVNDATFGTVLQLNGTNQYMQLPNALLQDVGTYSISIWFKSTTGGVLLGMQNAPYGATPSVSESLLYVGTDGTLYEAVNLGFGVSPYAVAQVNDGQWHHAFIDVTSTTTNLFLDGSWKVGFGPTGSYQWITYTSSVSYSQIGAGYTTTSHTATPGGWFTFGGEIGEVAIFNRTFPYVSGVWTNSEISNIISAGKTGICQPSQEGITASDLAISPGSLSSLSPLSYTIAPDSPTLSTPTSCYTSANGVSRIFPAYYQNAITCSNAVAAGYAFTYRAGTLTLGTPTAGTDPIVEPDAYVAQYYQYSAYVSNAAQSSTYSLGGTPPPGIGIIPSSGVLSGTPTKAGDYSFTVNWTNGSSSGSQPVRLKVLPGYGNLIVSTYTPSPASGNVYRVDPNTGSQTLLASVSNALVDVAVDPNTGTTYALSNTGTVYAITSSGTVSTFYSNSTLGYTYAIAIDNSSNVYFATNTAIYKLNPSAQLVNVVGTVTNSQLMANPVGGNNSPRMIFDRDGNLLIAGDASGAPRVSSSILTGAQINTSNVYSATSAGNIVGMDFARDGSGDLILADAANNSIIRISQLHAANLVTTLMTSASAFNSSLVGIVAGNAVPFNEYYVGEGTGWGSYKIVPQTSVSVPLANYSQPHQSAITWYRYNQTAITVATPTTTGFTAGNPYNFALQAIGGNGSYSWSQTGFPPGLNLTTGGVVTGTPTTAGSYPVTIHVSDTAGNVGIAQFTFAVSANLQPLTLTASNQTMTYGGTAPAPTFTTSPTGVTLTSQPTCTYGGLPSPLVVGTYTGAITCSGAAATGYAISYSPGNLTVNPAPLTVTANSFVTPYGTALPTTTASITGFVNNDTVQTATSGAPALSVNVPTGNPAGVYAISALQGTLSASNYTFTFVPGTLTISAVLQTPTLGLLNNYIMPGDYVARGTDNGLSPSATPNYVTGTITIPAYNSGGSPDGVPSGAEVVAAYLYWQALETSSSPSSSFAMFNGYNIFGNSVGSDLSSGCWKSATQGAIMRAYRSNVTAFLPVTNGANSPVGTHSVTLPQSVWGNSATLVVIYRSLDPSTAFKATIVYDGNWSQDYPQGYTPTFNLNLTGFYDSMYAGGAGRMTDITSLVYANGDFSFTPQTQFASLTLPDASASLTMPNNFAPLQSGQCRVWAATIFSTPVHSSDNDGIIDSWKTGPKPPNPNAGLPGYYDAITGAWVDLTGAAPGQRDLFVQIDYMVGSDGHTHMPSTNALNMVTHSLASHGVTPHFVIGNPIPEDTCTGTSTDSLGNTLYCVFPGETGVVAWKVGLEDLKTEAVNANACTTFDPGNPACLPRFPYGRRSSYHYVLFGHSLGIANWSINDGTLSNIVVSGGGATVNLTVPFKACPTTVTITNAMVTLGLNGTYSVNSCPTNTSFTVTTKYVPDGTYPVFGGPPGTAEPTLAVVNGTTGTISGYSDVGGSDSVITLGKWGTDGTRDNVVAGTMMHELGHTLGLSHGGSYNGFGTAAVYGSNCKPNYQSIMNYLFQVDGLGPNAAIDYSSQFLSNLDKSALGTQILGLSTTSNTAPLYSTTTWYSPIPPFNAGTPATRRCDGSLPNGEVEYLVTGAANPVAWSSGQDINFDGQSSEILQGYNDWLYIDFRQVGATGGDTLPYPIGLADGGIQLSGGGGIQLSGGGGIQLSGGGGIQRTGGGGIQRSGGGGIQLSGGGGIQLSGGGGIQRTGGGGIQLSGGGGIQRAGGGGIQRTGGGGVDAEIKFETANAVVRPPRGVVTSGNTINWTAPLFGNVTGYNIYCSTNGGAPMLIATVPASQLSFTGGNVSGNNCTVTTILTDTSTNTTRESTAPNPPTSPQPQTIKFPNPGPVYFSTQPVALHATATSGLPVMYAVPPNSPCTVSGSTMQMLTFGTCNITASQNGSAFAKPAQPVTDPVVINPWTISGFTPPVNMSTSSTVVWNTIKGGQTVPLKFNVYIGSAQQTSTSIIVGQTVSIYPASCVSGVDTTDQALTNVGNTALRFDGSQFIQNWKTPSGSGCYTATVKTLDGSSITAYFKTK